MRAASGCVCAALAGLGSRLAVAEAGGSRVLRIRDTVAAAVEGRLAVAASRADARMVSRKAAACWHKVGCCIAAVAMAVEAAAGGIVVAVADTAFGCCIAARPGCPDSIRQKPFRLRAGACSVLETW
jgi:hypothetical protein